MPLTLMLGQKDGCVPLRILLNIVLLSRIVLPLQEPETPGMTCHILKPCSETTSICKTGFCSLPFVAPLQPCRKVTPFPSCTIHRINTTGEPELIVPSFYNPHHLLSWTQQPLFSVDVANRSYQLLHAFHAMRFQHPQLVN